MTPLAASQTAGGDAARPAPAGRRPFALQPVADFKNAPRMRHRYGARADHRNRLQVLGSKNPSKSTLSAAGPPAMDQRRDPRSVLTRRTDGDDGRSLQGITIF